MTMHESILAPDLNLIRQHLDAWSAPYIGTEYEDGLCEIAFTAPDGAAPDRARMFALDDLETAATFAADQNAKGANIYIGAALRAPDANPKGRGSSPDFYAAAFACCEADEHADTVAERIEAAGLKGAIRVRTGQHPGKRVHHWLPLRELCDDAEGYTEALRALVAHVGADAKVKDAARVLRLGGSVNWITDPTKKAKGYVDELTVIKTEEAPAADLDRLARLEPLPGWNPSAGGGRGGNGGPGEIVRNAAGIVTDGREAFWRQIVIAELAKYLARDRRGPQRRGTFRARLSRVSRRRPKAMIAGPLSGGNGNCAKRVARIPGAAMPRATSPGTVSIRSRPRRGDEESRRGAEEARPEAPRYRRSAQGLQDQGRRHLPLKTEGRRGPRMECGLCSPLRGPGVDTRHGLEGLGAAGRDHGDPDGNPAPLGGPGDPFLPGWGVLSLSECFRLGCAKHQPGGAAKFHDPYCNNGPPKTRATSSERLGWADGSCRAFILGDGRVIGDESVVYQSENVPWRGRRKSMLPGPLDDWRNQYCGSPALAIR